VTGETIIGTIVDPDTGLQRVAGLSFDSGVVSSIEHVESASLGPAQGQLTLVPGFVDIQVNGAGAVDVSSASVAQLGTLCEALAKTGVTAWLPTVVTRPLDQYPAVLDRIGEVVAAQQSGAVGGAEVAGIHLEGPFLGGRPGAHRPELMVAPTVALIEKLPDLVKLVTLGAEVDGAVEATLALVERGIIVSIGHTAASVEQLEAVHQAGATLVTHLYNAMTGVHHRDEGVASWALTTDELSAAIIADGHHVGNRALSIALRCKRPDKVIAVTDTVAHLRGGMSGGGDGSPARLADGTIAGGTADMAQCFAKLVLAGASIAGAIAATSTNPAKLIGLGGRGAIRVGSRADLVGLDENHCVQAVWAAGRRLA